MYFKEKIKSKIILFIIIAIIFFIPLFFWNNHLYVAGGDDSLLYYQFPWQIIKNYLFNIVSDNVLSGLGVYGTQAYMFPFYLLILLVKSITPFINTQLLFYGLNLSLGFLFFYLLLGIWIKNKNWYDFWIKISTGLFYSFSIFVFYTQWSSQLFSMYLISIFPLALYLFVRGIQEKRLFYIILDSLILSLFSILLLSSSWLIPLTISVLPLMFFLFWQCKKRFLVFLGIFISLTFLLNFYWLFHFLYSPYSSNKLEGDIVSTTISKELREGNEYLIRAVSGHNQLIYPLFNLFHKNIQIDYGWKSYEIFSNWHEKFLPFNLLFLVIILLGAVFSKKSEKIYKLLYTSFLIAWLIMLFLFTANIDNWGLKVFLWFTNNIPGFVMFRNMYSKFGLALAFCYAFLLGISLKIFFDQIKKTNFKKVIPLFIIISIFALTIINAKPFIFGEYYKNPIWTTKNTFNTISDFNQDFYDLSEYLKTIDEPSHFLWLPLNLANYIQIQDKNLSNHYYSGVSPLQFLANKSDFSGQLSFGKEGSELFEKIVLEKKYNEAGLFFQKMNVKYIILNNDISRDLQKSYLYGWYFQGDVFYAQNKEFMQVILGEKIKDFGHRYSLYKINNNFKNEKIYLTERLDKIPNDFLDLDYTKKASYQYEINIKNLNDKQYLVFLDPYHKQWELYFRKDNTNLIKGSHEVVFNYANGWAIDPEYIKKNFDKSFYKENPDGSIDLELTLYFKPQSYFYLGLGISGITFLGCFGYLGYDWRRKRKIRTIQSNNKQNGKQDFN